MSEINDTVQPGNEMNPELEAMDQRAGPETSADSLQTDPETGQDERIQIEGPADLEEPEASLQTEAEEPKPKRRRKKTAPAETQSDTEASAEAARTADDAEEAENTGTAEVEVKEPSTYQKLRSFIKPNERVLGIDGRRTVETAADRSKSDLLDMLESLKSKRILSGNFTGLEEQGSSGRNMAVIYHGSIKVVIPAHELVELPEEQDDRPEMYVYNDMLLRRLGAEVDYIVKGIDPENGIAVASRLEAMKAKQKQYYFGTDRDGNYLLYTGAVVEARVVSVVRGGVFVEVFGIECWIAVKDLTYRRVLDATILHQPGDRVLVRIMELDRSQRDNLRVEVSAKEAMENPFERATRRYVVGNKYVGTVGHIDVNGVFVTLEGELDCLCSLPKRGRPLPGARVTVRIVGVDTEQKRIWGVITHASSVL